MCFRNAECFIHKLTIKFREHYTFSDTFAIREHYAFSDTFKLHNHFSDTLSFPNIFNLCKFITFFYFKFLLVTL